MSTVPNRPPGPRHNSNVGLGPVGADGMSGPEVGGAEVGGAAGTVPTPVQLVEFTDRRFRCFPAAPPTPNTATPTRYPGQCVSV